jgi:hypothetical protein
MLKAVQVTLYTMEYFSPSMGDPAPKVNIHTTNAFEGRHILTVVTLSSRSVNETGPSFAELNVDSSENVTLSHVQTTLL